MTQDLTPWIRPPATLAWPLADCDTATSTICVSGVTMNDETTAATRSPSRMRIFVAMAIWAGEPEAAAQTTTAAARLAMAA